MNWAEFRATTLKQLVVCILHMGALPALYSATASTIKGGEYIAPDRKDGKKGYPTSATRSLKDCKTLTYQTSCGAFLRP